MKGSWIVIAICLISLVVNVGCEGFVHDDETVTCPLVDTVCVIPKAVTDVDGNTYDAVQIGKQIWMAENMKTTRYADGVSIPKGQAGSLSFSTPFRYAPHSNEALVQDFGYLYNWFAVTRGATVSDQSQNHIQGICPNGWHVPTNSEWVDLTNYVSKKSQYLCSDNDRNIAKALASTSNWKDCSWLSCAVGNESYTNNATGFSALPAGNYGYGNSDDFGSFAYFWSASVDPNESAVALSYMMTYYSPEISQSNYGKGYGFSVRCVRD